MSKTAHAHMRMCVCVKHAHQNQSVNMFVCLALKSFAKCSKREQFAAACYAHTFYTHVLIYQCLFVYIVYVMCDRHDVYMPCNACATAC